MGVVSPWRNFWQASRMGIVILHHHLMMRGRRLTMMLWKYTLTLTLTIGTYRHPTTEPHHPTTAQYLFHHLMMRGRRLTMILWKYTLTLTLTIGTYRHPTIEPHHPTTAQYLFYQPLQSLHQLNATTTSKTMASPKTTY